MHRCNDVREAVRALSRDLKFPDGKGFYPDEKDGVAGYNTDPARGADTFRPFSNIPDEMTVYIGGAHESGSASFSRAFLDAMGYTKMELHPKKTNGRGMNTFNAYESFVTSDRIEYNITTEKTIDVSSSSPYTKGITILQPANGTTIMIIGYVKFLK